MNNLDKKYFIISFVSHVVVIFLLAFFNIDNKIHRHFLVLGAHSKRPTHAYFKPLKALNKTNWLGARNKSSGTSGAKSKIKAPKKQFKKSEIKKTIKPQIKKTPKAKMPAPVKKEVKNNQPKIKKLKEIKPKQIKKETEMEKPNEEKRIEVKNEKIEPEIPKTSPSNPQNEGLKEEEEIHFNLLGENDPNLAIYQKQIQKEVQRLWRPPVGVAKGTECSASFLIDSNGKVAKFEFINRSEILIYDLSVSRIAKNFNFEKSLWSKKIIIDFRQ